ncbi:hypothetical protein AVEN_213249-1 [Araneus ventricosus]|uniref:Uncharacterized protein n=1 Tax=Araneus ventricosus TaxID=182803 RepID=A0A4Y2JGL2_ARAVE|nr:hypothetical protein AVEN_213249-1 [Araneus ventricosus]
MVMESVHTLVIQVKSINFGIHCAFCWMFSYISVPFSEAARGTTSPNFRTTPAGGHFAPTGLTRTRPAYMAVLRWNPVTVGFRTCNSRATKSRPHHQATAACILLEE